MVQRQHLDAGDLLDHCFHDRPGCFDQMGTYLFEQVAPLLGRQRSDEMLFGGGQNSPQTNHEQIAEQVGMDVLGATAHVILLKATDSLANGGFEFSLRLHSDSSSTHQGGDLRTKAMILRPNMNRPFPHRRTAQYDTKRGIKTPIPLLFPPRTL